MVSPGDFFCRGGGAEVAVRGEQGDSRDNQRAARVFPLCERRLSLTMAFEEDRREHCSVAQLQLVLRSRLYVAEDRRHCEPTSISLPRGHEFSQVQC